MKKLLLAALAPLALMAMATHSPAQIIVWGSAENMTGNPDIETAGSYFDAVSAYGAIMVNNGVGGIGGTNVQFNALSGNPASDGKISITIGDDIGNFTAPFTTASPSSASYQNLVDTGVFGAGGSSVVTISGLTMGDSYQVESWSYYTGDSSTARTEYSGSAGVDSVALNNSVGQFAIGTFTATGPTEFYDFTSANGAHQFVNAVLVQDTTESSSTPEPSTYLLLGAGLLGLVFVTRRKVRA